MRPAGLPLIRLVSLVAGLTLLGTGLAEAHEIQRQRPAPRQPIDPRQSFPFLAISGAGGHFHALLLVPGGLVFAGTHLGLFQSEDRGVNWRLTARRFNGEEVHGLGHDPRTGRLYVATHGQGVLRSEDGGRSWRSAGEGLPARDVHALALDPGGPERLYVWVVKHGLFRTEDAGETWSPLAEAGALPDVESLVVHPGAPERVYAGTAKGVWVSVDGGRRWRFPAGGLPHRTAAVSVPPWRLDLLFAATLEGAFAGKTDGTNWQPVPSHPAWWGLITAFAFLPGMPEIVFAVTHEGIVATRRLQEHAWFPLADPSNSALSRRQKERDARGPVGGNIGLRALNVSGTVPGEGRTWQHGCVP